MDPLVIAFGLGVGVHGDAFNTTLLWIVSGVLAMTALITLARALFMPALVARERHEVALHRHTKVADLSAWAIIVPPVAIGILAYGVERSRALRSRVVPV